MQRAVTTSRLSGTTSDALQHLGFAPPDRRAAKASLKESGVTPSVKVEAQPVAGTRIAAVLVEMVNLSVSAVTRIAEGAAREQSSALEVMGVTLSREGNYAEVLINVRGCRREPCQVALGVFRNATESALRHEISEKLREHVRDHAIVP